jgi:hemerythrin
MPFLTWDPALSVGLREIDTQHRQLLLLLNEFHDASQAGKPPELVGEALARLKDYARKHFATEEQLMRKVGYPGLAEHQALHRLVQRKVEFLLGGMAKGKVPAAAVARFLSSWYVRHLDRADRQYADFIRASQPA